MLPPPRPRRGESPPRSSWRSCHSVSRSPGTPWFWRRNSRPGAATCISPGHAPAAPSGSAPPGSPPPLRTDQDPPPASPHRTPCRRPEPRTGAPNRSPSGSAGTPVRSCAWPGRTVNRTRHPGASTTATALPVRSPRERPVPCLPVPLPRPPPSGAPGRPRRRRPRAQGRTRPTTHRKHARKPRKASSGGTAWRRRSTFRSAPEGRATAIPRGTARAPPQGTAGCPPRSLPGRSPCRQGCSRSAPTWRRSAPSCPHPSFRPPMSPVPPFRRALRGKCRRLARLLAGPTSGTPRSAPACFPCPILLDFRHSSGRIRHRLQEDPVSRRQRPFGADYQVLPTSA